MEKEPVQLPENRIANVASRAVGVEKIEYKRRWVIGLVLNNTEISTRDKLLNLGYEAYVPSQIEIRVWRNGRKKKAERIFFKNWVFLHVTEAERQEAVNTPWVKEYYKGRGRDKTKDCPVLVIPDDQMERMQFILSNAEATVEISNHFYKKGEEIEVVRGKLAGLKGYVAQDSDGKHALIVELGILGHAKVQIDISQVKSVE